MNSDHETKTGGASITPSARRSIHNHQGGCIFSAGETTSMGTYGLNSETSKERRTSIQSTSTGLLNDGEDVVDNIMSKSASPINSRRIAGKRNSLGGDIHTDDSDNNSKLAKSLPTRLEPLLSPYSDYDEYGHWPSSFGELNKSNESNRSRRNWQEDDSSIRSNFESLPNTPRSLNTSRNQSRRQETKMQPSTLLLTGFLISVIIAAALVVYNGNLPTTIPALLTKGNVYNTAQFYDELNHLGGKYKITDNTILQLQTGISTIFKRQDTGSFVLAYKSSDRDFDYDTFNNLVNTIAAAASKYLRNDSTSVQHIVVDGSKLEMRSHSELISKYRDEVTKTGVMLVREVDEVPSALAMAFHYYCDEYNPLVKRSAIFFTLDMAKCSPNPVEQYPAHAQIEKCLAKKWSGVPKDNISPLLNRVVSTVLNVAGV